MLDPFQNLDETALRILEAAEEVFAEKGFVATTIRDIVERAGLKNIAAVNYHFGDKESLYIAAVKYAHRNCVAGVPLPTWPSGATPRAKLREFVATLVARIFRPQRACSQQLMMRELIEPSRACREVVDEFIRPMAAVLESIVAEMLPEMPPERRFMFGCSVIGQVIFYRTHRAFLSHLLGPEKFDGIDSEAIVEHVTNFSLAGLEAARRAGERRS